MTSRLISPSAIALLFASLLILTATTVPAAAQAATPAPNPDVIDPVVHALCHEHVALLGEPPIHGLGNTLDFKVLLVRRLVTQCHYNALFVEGGLYDFLHIQQDLRSGHEVSAAAISAAIGGLWANHEVQSLVPFLQGEVNQGRLTLGGLDDAIGAGTYASRDMASDLVQPLAGAEKPRCLAVLERHLHWQYTEAAPYSPVDKEKILGCLDQISTALSSAHETSRSIAESRAEVDSLQRNLARNFTEDDFTDKAQELRWSNDRDRSMYLNFKWLAARLPPHSKVIVWAATVHTAKDLSGIPGFEGRVPLGAYLHKDAGRHAFSLGFSALAGDYAFTHQPIRQLSAAPASSLEARTFAHTSATVAFLSRQQLQHLGPIPARPLGTDFTAAPWDRVVDGLIVFRSEHAPAWIKRPSP